MEEKKIKITLKYPIPVPIEGSDKTIETNELYMGRLKTKHLRLMKDSFDDQGNVSMNPTDIIPLIAAITGLPEVAVDEIDAEDLIKVAEIVSDFFETSPAEDGSSSSGE